MVRYDPTVSSSMYFCFSCRGLATKCRTSLTSQSLGQPRSHVTITELKVAPTSISEAHCGCWGTFAFPSPSSSDNHSSKDSFLNLPFFFDLLDLMESVHL